MNENDSASPRQGSIRDGKEPFSEDNGDVSLRQVAVVMRQNFPWLLKRAAAVIASLLLLLVLLTGFAGVYTSRPEFCRSCHNMEPYYTSWQESSHRDVSCIKCHFPPGVGEEVRGKMLGLVQLAKYVTRSEGPRPAAEIPDASCLRSGCHERRLLSGRVEFHGVPFDHRPHLKQMRRGKKLRCTSCHSQIVQGEHMTVTESTCFLCHFKDGLFNEGLGACTRCHQIPEEHFDLGGGAKFSHELAYQRGVDCANCHGDLIRGNGQVPRERCSVCHNRADDLERIGDHEFLHRKHVTEHKIDCLECHLEIQHSLDPDRIPHAASNCAACHPNHHQEQVQMLEGIGAQSISPQASEMVAARIACPSCHQVKEVSPTGTVLWKASVKMCEVCHAGEDTSRRWMLHDSLNTSLAEMDAGIARVRAARESARLSAERSAKITEELKVLEHDLNFLRVGNGIHNIHYATTLARTMLERLSLLCRELKVAEPKVTLPENAERKE